MKGRVTPVMGTVSVTVPILSSAWNAIQVVIPAARAIPKRSVARIAAR
jgi:hypothetical protein